jgi:hypothetical protein
LDHLGLGKAYFLGVARKTTVYEFDECWIMLDDVVVVRQVLEVSGK